MLLFNGKKYAKNDAEFTSSLFSAGNTCNGYYKKIKHGVQLFDIQHNLRAYIVDRPNGDQFIVSAHMHNGKPRYMHGLSSIDEKWLGVYAYTFASERAVVENMRFI